MRLLFINETHPATPHVAGMRLYHFASALGRRGHEVVQLTGPEPVGSAWLGGQPLPDAPRLVPLVPQSLAQPSSPLLRRLNTARRVLGSDSATRDWLELASREARGALEGFRPALIWATFGNIESLHLANRIAAELDCPWVADTKDNWANFVPHGLRRAVAKRLASVAGLTANARLHQDAAARAFPPRRTHLAYSGVAEPFFRARATVTASPLARRTLLLAGGTYRGQVLEDYVAVLDRWVRALPANDRARFRFRYVGDGHRAVTQAIAPTVFGDGAEVGPSIPLEEFAELVSSSFCTSYLWQPATFHHKLLELLVAAPAVIAYPGEHQESRELAAQCDTPFAVCRDPTQLTAALGDHWAASARSATPTSAPAWRWDDFAVGLEGFFEAIATGRAAHGTEI